MKFENIVVETERLHIRLEKEKDVEGLFAMFSEPETMRYWSTLPLLQVSQAKQRMKETIAAYEKGESLRLAVTLKGEDNIVGELSLFHIVESCERAEIGYILAKPYWRQGIMAEALVAFLEFCFNTLKLRRLEADIDPDNAASKALLLKVGFEKEGLLKERWLVDGKATDSELYGLLK